MPCQPAQAFKPALGQMIIAGSCEDISPADMLGWITPLLSGIGDGQWLTCEIERSGRWAMTARLRTGAMAPHLTLCHSIPRLQAARLMRLKPRPAPAAVVMLNEHAAQVMTLLDGMAAWLYLFEADDPAIAAVTAMLAGCNAPADAHALTAKKTAGR